MPRRLRYFREDDADLQGTALHLFLRAVESCMRAQPRFDGLPSAELDSHLYSASPVECWQVNQFYGTEWQIESDNVLEIDLPNATNGACPGGTFPVYRAFNHRADANHRYTTSAVIRAQMKAAGWIRERYGPTATILCATSF